MKKNSEAAPTQPEIIHIGKKPRKTLDFSLDELYMLVGSVAFMTTVLEKERTEAHKLKSLEYAKLLKKMDNAFVDLHMLQSEGSTGAIDLALAR